MLVVIFSKDRAMQLSACLDSLFTNCKDLGNNPITVLYKTSSDLHKNSYIKLVSEYYKKVRFVKENDFKTDLMKIVLGSLQGAVMFVTDDTIFIKDFNIKDVVNALYENENALGLSLRLGMNTTYCYMTDNHQSLPDFTKVNENIFKYTWTNAEHDFGYPLELSSSVYRISQIHALFMTKNFKNPNTLESSMFLSLDFYKKVCPELLLYKTSRAFSNPCNIVQSKKTNRHGNISADKLAEDFNKGRRIDVSKYKNIVTNSVHQEEELFYI